MCRSHVRSLSEFHYKYLLLLKTCTRVDPWGVTGQGLGKDEVFSVNC